MGVVEWCSGEVESIRYLNRFANSFYYFAEVELNLYLKE